MGEPSRGEGLEGGEGATPLLRAGIHLLVLADI